MRLQSEFIKLPVKFDVNRLKQEALQFTESDWDTHPLNYSGNSALHLVSVKGSDNHAFEGEMKPTKALQKCPYISQIFDSFNTVIGRSRLMRLDAKSDVPPHSDGNYSWRHRTRVHIPIITDPRIIFSSIGNQDVHMAPGEAWTFDNWRQHAVYNNSDIRRIHLVFDTIGTSTFWDIVKKGESAQNDENNRDESERLIPFESEKKTELLYERYNSCPIRSPDEISNMLDDLLSDLSNFQRTNPENFRLVEKFFGISTMIGGLTGQSIGIILSSLTNTKHFRRNYFRILAAF